MYTWKITHTEKPTLAELSVCTEPSRVVAVQFKTDDPRVSCLQLANASSFNMDRIKFLLHKHFPGSTLLRTIWQTGGARVLVSQLA